MVFNRIDRNNQVSNEGGAIQLLSLAYMYIYDSIFFNNSCGANGGALKSFGGRILIDNTFFLFVFSFFDLKVLKNQFLTRNNYALGNVSTGGGAIEAEQSQLTMNNCLFDSNWSSVLGGALWVGIGTQIDLGNCFFYGNYVNNSGGAIYIQSREQSTVSDCYFIENSAGLFGGAIQFNISTTLQQIWSNIYIMYLFLLIYFFFSINLTFNLKISNDKW